MNIGFDYKNYFSISGGHTFSPRLMMGFADKALPFNEQYSLGGQNSFFFKREDGIRDYKVTGVQTCALPILGLDPLGSHILHEELAWGSVDLSIAIDRKSTRLNSSHLVISYAVFCLKKK